MAHVRDNFLCGKEKSQDVLRAPLGHHNNGDGCPGDGWEMKLQGLFFKTKAKAGEGERETESAEEREKREKSEGEQGVSGCRGPGQGGE